MNYPGVVRVDIENMLEMISCIWCTTHCSPKTHLILCFRSKQKEIKSDAGDINSLNVIIMGNRIGHLVTVTCFNHESLQKQCSFFPPLLLLVTKRPSGPLGDLADVSCSSCSHESCQPCKPRGYLSLVFLGRQEAPRINPHLSARNTWV